MNKKEKLETIGTYVAILGTTIPVFFSELTYLFWMPIVLIGFVFLVYSTFQPKEESNE